MAGPGWDRQPKPIITEKSEVVTDKLLEVIPGAKYSVHAIDEIIAQVRKDAISRREHGREKYGVPLMSFNGRDCLMDAYEEVHDLAVYLMQLRMEEEDLVQQSNLQGMIVNTVGLMCQVKEMLERREDVRPDR